MDLNWEFSTLVDGKVAGSNLGYFSSKYKTMLLRWLDQRIILWSQEETTMDDHLAAQSQVIDMDDDRLMQYAIPALWVRLFLRLNQPISRASLNGSATPSAGSPISCSQPRRRAPP